MAEEDNKWLAVYGLEGKKASETLKNKNLTASLKSLIDEASVPSDVDKPVGQLLYQMVTRFPAQSPHRLFLAKYILAGDIKSHQLNAALTHIKSRGEAEIVASEFEKECGVGVTVTAEDIKVQVKAVLDAHASELAEKRYACNLGMLLKGVKDGLPWADPKALKETFDDELLNLLGPKTEEDKNVKKAKPEKEPAAKNTADANEPSTHDPDMISIKDIKLHAPHENFQKRPEILEKHLAETGGKVITRFPPEPNGLLHIGHAKAININFGYAKHNGGVCYLRFDDTNPVAEKQDYVDSIIETVRWMGHEPYQITYSSDRFDFLFENAVKLIKLGKAYVCHETAEQMHEGRESKRESPWRNRPVEENMECFMKMKMGFYGEGEATLRLKCDMQSPNPCMRDIVAYRIKYHPHPHVGSTWCIYPSYDYTHCLCDSYENITHSLCTLEFDIRRELYNWILDTLDRYRPPQREYSRLNISNTVLSKRKLMALVNEGMVDGWDDPRMPTIVGLRRRGYPAAAITAFVDSMGMTRSASMISMSVLENFVRSHMDANCTRAFCVLRPIKVVIQNYPEDKYEEMTAPLHPGNASMGTRSLPFSRVIYIDQSDFREKDSKEYFGLAPNKEVRLRYAYTIKCTGFRKNGSGEVTEITATYDEDMSKKPPKGVIHWVGTEKGVEPLKCEVRLYELLFPMEDPSSLGDDWWSHINPNSRTVVSGALMERRLRDAKAGDSVQFERLGFFTVDSGAPAGGQVVWNRTVALKDSREAKQAKK